jgi:hypothetical protein
MDTLAAGLRSDSQAQPGEQKLSRSISACSRKKRQREHLRRTATRKRTMRSFCAVRWWLEQGLQNLPHQRYRLTTVLREVSSQTRLERKRDHGTWWCFTV